MTIGRGEGIDVRLDDDGGVSRLHAELDPAPGSSSLRSGAVRASKLG
ncbi:MAG: FHA domain-containing protein [Actinomycetota bacterium]|nr:FHA domain-containing protein [Actinomycetota bacterium]